MNRTTVSHSPSFPPNLPRPHPLTIHTVPNMANWISVLQTTVTKIPNKGAYNMILLAGTDWTHAGNWVSLSSGLAAITNTDGSKDGLLFSVHDNFQGDGADPNAACTGLIQNAASDLACWLRANKRQAMFVSLSLYYLLLGSAESCFWQNMC